MKRAINNLEMNELDWLSVNFTYKIRGKRGLVHRLWFMDPLTSLTIYYLFALWLLFIFTITIIVVAVVILGVLSTAHLAVLRDYSLLSAQELFLAVLGAPYVVLEIQTGFSYMQDKHSSPSIISNPYLHYFESIFALQSGNIAWGNNLKYGQEMFE